MDFDASSFRNDLEKEFKSCYRQDISHFELTRRIGSLVESYIPNLCSIKWDNPGVIPQDLLPYLSNLDYPEKVFFYVIKSIWSYIKHRGGGKFATPNRFFLSRDLFMLLTLTQTRGLPRRAAKMPFEGFYIYLPQNTFYQIEGSHKIPVECLSVTSVDSTNRVMIGIHLLPGSHNPDISEYEFVTSWDETHIDQATASDSLDKFDVQWSCMGKTIVSKSTFFVNLVANLALYLSSETPDMCPRHAEDIRGLRKKLSSVKSKSRAAAALRDRIRKMSSNRDFNVGSTVRVPKVLRDVIRDSSNGCWASAYSTVVRGHFRDQAHGPGRTLRKRIWIEPHIRGSDPIGISHNYLL